MLDYEIYVYTNNVDFAKDYIIRRNKRMADKGWARYRLEKQRDAEKYRIVIPCKCRCELDAKIGARLMNLVFKGEEKLWLKKQERVV